ncbi:MAG TPA: hypothetical protein VMU39_11685 [Solirubrobacteraceae bacterium]|nr:hypothetical protein [Solirubrobacteraceae bacterium]
MKEDRAIADADGKGEQPTPIATTLCQRSGPHTRAQTPIAMMKSSSTLSIQVPGDADASSENTTPTINVAAAAARATHTAARRAAPTRTLRGTGRAARLCGSRQTPGGNVYDR